MCIFLCACVFSNLSESFCLSLCVCMSWLSFCGCKHLCISVLFSVGPCLCLCLCCCVSADVIEEEQQNAEQKNGECRLKHQCDLVILILLFVDYNPRQILTSKVGIIAAIKKMFFSGLAGSDLRIICFCAEWGRPSITNMSLCSFLVLFLH